MKIYKQFFKNPSMPSKNLKLIFGTKKKVKQKTPYKNHNKPSISSNPHHQLRFNWRILIHLPSITAAANHTASQQIDFHLKRDWKCSCNQFQWNFTNFSYPPTTADAAINMFQSTMAVNFCAQQISSLSINYARYLRLY